MRLIRIKWLLFVAIVVVLTGVRLTAADIKSQSLSSDPSCQVSLSWEPSPDPNAIGYFLYYGVNDSGMTNRLDAGNQTSLILNGLQPGAVYQFAVTAYDASGVESEPSNEVQYFAPAPQSVAFQALSSQDHTLRLNFQTVAGGVYRVEASDDLVNWATVVTTNCVSGGPVSIPVADTTASPARFFRMVQDH